MPPILTTNQEAKTRILAKNKEWAKKLREAAAEPVKAPKLIPEIIANVADELTGVASYNTDCIDHLQKSMKDAISSSKSAVDASNAALEEAGCCSKNIQILNASIEAQEKDMKKLEVKIKATSDQNKMAQLQKCQTVIVCKNVQPTKKGEETYEDLMEAFGRCLGKIRLSLRDIGIDYIRRLKKASGDNSSTPPPVRVELSSLADKMTIFNSLKASIQKQKQDKTGKKSRIDFSVSTEIPQYALSSYKFLGRLSKVWRDNDKGIKTKVSIPRGKLQPALYVRKRGQNDYRLATEEELKRVKADLIKATQAKGAGKSGRNDGQERMDEDDILLLNAGEEDMTGT
jgi:hypothetical protein